MRLISSFKQLLRLRLQKNPAAKRAKKILLLILLCSSFFVTLFFANEQLRIKNIIISAKNKNIRGLSLYQHRNILFLSTSIAEKEILQKNPQAQQVSVNKVFPHTIRVEVRESIPLVNLKVSSGFFRLSEDGRILNKLKQDDKKVPVIRYYQTFDTASYEAGQFLNLHDLLTTLFLVKKLKDLDITVENVAIDGPHMIVFKVRDREFLFSSEKAKEKTAFELETIVRQFTIEGKDFKSLDLRFDKPIVKF